MNRIGALRWTGVLLVVCSLLVACEASDDSTPGQDTVQSEDAVTGLDSSSDVVVENPGHTVDMNGFFHMPGKEDPLKNCTGCHGDKLKGDLGPSCYTCHDNSDHTSSRGGHKHKSGGSSTCNVCHGPGNKGGLGPACSKCH